MASTAGCDDGQRPDGTESVQDARQAKIQDDAPGIPIVGGLEAQLCQWPSVVAMREDDETPVMCSGSLIHPEVVLTAAHCISQDRPIVEVGFGEQGQGDVGPTRIVPVTECVAHPQYDRDGISDVAYCRLAQPVTDVPIVPLLAGCEAQALAPGQQVTIVGFGATYGTVENDRVMATGAGPKRFTTQSIDYVDAAAVEVNLSGPNGSQSACFGDSGGPAMIQLGDGTWRVFGTGSHLYDPGDLPPPMEDGNICGTGVAYGYVLPTIPWLEAEVGIDLTPCWDGDEFVGGSMCQSLPVDPARIEQGWANGCGGGPTLAGTLVCDPARGEDGTGTGGGREDTGDAGATDTDGEGPSDSASTGTSDPIHESTASAGDDDGGASVPTSDGAGDGSDGASGEEAGQDADSQQGCGCQQRPGDASPLWLIMAPVLLAWRRRRA